MPRKKTKGNSNASKPAPVAPAAPAAPAPVEASTPSQTNTRDELLKKCRAARQNARARGSTAPRSKKPTATAPGGAAGGAGGGAGAAAGIELPISDEERKEQELLEMKRELTETCGGDIEEFLQRQGIDARALPAIRNSISRLENGVCLEKALVDTMKALHLVAYS